MIHGLGRRKFPATLLLRAIGISTNKDLFEAFGMLESLPLSDKNILDKTLIGDLVNQKTGEIIIESGAIIDAENLKILKKNKITNTTIYDIKQEK